MVQVGIIMGSDSDLACMSEAAKILERFDIEYDITILSAHRTPDRAKTYARSAEERGLKAIIAGAGGAAHLPGVIAAFTALPVIGVPIQTAALGGVDSLYSIAQMPTGIPVATVAIGGAANAGILAAQIVGAADPDVRAKIWAYKKGLEESVNKKAAKLEDVGYAAYLKQMKN